MIDFDIDRVIKVLENEKKCVIRNIMHECSRDCAKCDLVRPDKDVVITAYNFALEVLNDVRDILNNKWDEE